MTASELSSELALSPEGAELMLSSLTAKAYLRKRGNSFTLAPASSKWLVRGSPQYMGNFLRYIGLLHQHWMSLDVSLKKGKPARSYVGTFTSEEWVIYTDGMMDLARLIIPRLLPCLTIPPQARSLLDVGGSHGLYTIELCRRHPELKGMIADFPVVLVRTGEIVREHGLSDRITLLPIDVTSPEFEPGRHDVVLMFNIVHGLTPETNRRLIAKVAAAMSPGGKLFILDQFKREKSRGADRLLPLMVGVNLLNEIGGNVYGVEEVRKWCIEAGLRGVTARRLPLPGVGLLSGIK
jgi:hypothetical protein